MKEMLVPALNEIIHVMCLALNLTLDALNNCSQCAHYFYQHLLSSYCVPGVFVGVGDIKMKKI